MKRRIVSLILALTLATTMLLGGLTAQPASAGGLAVNASACSYAGNYCRVRWYNYGTAGNTYVRFVFTDGSYDPWTFYVPANTWYEAYRWIYPNQAVSYIGIDAPGQICCPEVRVQW